MKIREYTQPDEFALFELMKEEGDEWIDGYASDENTKQKYICALETSITYVVMEDNLLCGYIRCRDDGGFGIYILDLFSQQAIQRQRIWKILN